MKGDLVKTVAGDIEKYNLFEKGSRIVAGVSGGADSVCLLKVLCELKDEYNLSITAVHVNHGLRGSEAEKDQEYVTELCQKWEVPLRIFRADIKALSNEKKISLEEAGRIARYSFFNQVLKEHGANYIAVAHQLEDQAETVMHHILRGTGIDGLCGMSIKQGNIVRPLLNISRDEIIKYLDENGIPYCIDSTNLESEYTRNRIRNELFPFIRDNFMVNPVAQLARLSNIAREEQEFLENAAKEAYEKAVLNDSGNVELSLTKLKDFPDAIKKRIIRIAWEKINNNRKNLEYVHIEQLMALLTRGQTGKKAELPQGFEVRISYDKLIFSKKMDKSTAPYSYRVNLNGITVANEANGVLNASVMSMKEAKELYGPPESLKEGDFVQFFDYNKLGNGIVLRNRIEGDRIRPRGSRGEKRLKEFFIDEKIPREKRDEIPLIARDNKIVWIVGMRTSQDFRADKDTEKVLVLTWTYFQNGGDRDDRHYKDR